MNKTNLSRRDFLHRSAATAGMVTLGVTGAAEDADSPGSESGQRLPREVWIASLSQMNLKAGTSGQMIDKVIQQLDDILVYKPDIICLPEN